MFVSKLTRVDKIKFNREYDLWLAKITEVNSELNKQRIESDRLSRELADKECKLKESINSLVLIENETLSKKQEKEIYDKVLSDGQGLLSNLKEDIEIKQSELDKLISGIDNQVEDNQQRLELETKELKINKQKVEDELGQINKELVEQKKEKEILEQEVAGFKKDLEKKRQEYKSLSIEMKKIEEDTKQKNAQAHGSLSHSNEREKQLNFYNSRLQRMAKKMGVQLKNI